MSICHIYINSNIPEILLCNCLLFHYICHSRTYIKQHETNNDFEKS